VAVFGHFSHAAIELFLNKMMAVAFCNLLQQEKLYGSMTKNQPNNGYAPRFSR